MKYNVMLREGCINIGTFSPSFVNKWGRFTVIADSTWIKFRSYYPSTLGLQTYEVIRKLR